MPFPEYNLSVLCVDGSIYGFICDDKIRLLNFLKTYDHEGSSVSLVKRSAPTDFETFEDGAVYSELEGKEQENG